MMAKLRESCQAIELADIGIPQNLRQGYSQLNNLGTEETEDEPAGNHQEFTKSLQDVTETPEPHPLSICCAVLSLAGVVFLCIIGSIVASNSMYINVTPPEGKPKSSLALGIFGGACFYMVTFVLSALSFLRAKRASRVFELSKQIHSEGTSPDDLAQKPRAV